MSQGTETMTGPVLQGFALSPQQQHLWMLCSTDGPRPYRAEAAIRIAGDLAAEALAAALRRVVARHEILRTRFECLPGMTIPLQVVGEADLAWEGERRLAAPLPSGRELDAIFAGLARRAEVDGQQPTLRALLLRPPHGAALLCLSLPALCADEATVRHLVSEIAGACAAGLDGSEPADEPLQFADVAAWLNELLDSEEMARQRPPWSPESLLPLLAASVPGDRGPGGGFAPEVVPLALDRGVLEGRSVEPGAFLLACWQVLLWRHLDRAELVVSVRCAGRGFEELQGALGPLARYLPIPARLRGGERFRQLARRVARDLLQAQSASGGFSWERLVPGSEAAEPAPAPAFAFDGGDPEGAASAEAAGALFSLTRGRVHGDRFSLKLVATALGDGRAEIHYDASRFDAAAVEALARRFEAVVRRAAAAEEQPVGELDVLTGVERRHLVVELNRTRADLGAEARLHRLVRAQAERTPGKIAVRSGDESLTYAELMARSAALARRLRRLGAGPEERIAILAERSPEMVVGLLGILAAGGAYVPLDPDHPRERLAAILADTAPRLLVAQKRLAELVPAYGGVTVELGEPAGEAEPQDLPPEVVGDSHLAYVIHTSGSTGRPKGVMVSHRAIANRLLWMQREFPLAGTDRVLQKTPYSFDASIWEIFCPLLAGAELVMARPGGHADSAYLVREVAASRITVLQLVPSLLHPFLEEPAVAECTSLERVFCGGEELTTALAERFGRRLAARLHNLYGPTEAAIDATFWVCRPAAAPGRGVPIGRPLANMEVHVLNSRLLPAPPEVPGELFIGGTGLARGYRGRPGETAARFLPNPWSEVPGERLYRTGDLVRRRPEGEIEYLGRIDRQVKIRGARIELREIEAVLGEHPGVAQAVVVALPEEEAGAGARLVAYAVPRDGEVDLAELRLHASERLPSYMVPQTVMTLRTLPRLPSGKIDFGALPEPEPAAGSLAGDHVAPRTPVEQVLAGAWADVLGIAPPGIGDNFFDLGGHSLRATQLVTRLRHLLRVELSVRDLFQWPTIALLAERVEEVRRRAVGLEAPPVVAVPRDRPLPLSFAQQRLWFLYRMRPDSSYYNIPIVLEFHGELDVAALRGTLGSVARRHESLRTRFYEGDDGEPLQRIDPPSVPPLPVVDLSSLPPATAAAEADRCLAAEIARPFNLGTGPIFRALLFRRRADDHLGVLNQHHITADGWSTAILVREVAAVYRALRAGERPQLPELEIQYADFASWQREWLQGEVLEALIAYWRDRLQGAPPLLELPSDRPRPAVRTYRGANAVRQLAAGLDAGLEDLARKGGVTLFMALVAAVQALLRWVCGRDDIVIGTDVANRNRGETEGLVGFFINQLALRTDLSGDPSFTQLLERVREVSLGAYAHEDLPFEKLVETVNPERSRGYSPLFQVKVNLLNVPTPDLELPGLELKPLTIARDTAQFDLILNFVPGPQTLVVSADYSTELFDPKTIERLLAQLETVLTVAVTRPEIRLGELDAELGSAEEARQRAELEAERQARGRGLSRRSRRAARRVPPGGERAAS